MTDTNNKPLKRIRKNSKTRGHANTLWPKKTRSSRDLMMAHSLHKQTCKNKLLGDRYEVCDLCFNGIGVIVLYKKE